MSVGSKYVVARFVCRHLRGICAAVSVESQCTVVRFAGRNLWGITMDKSQGQTIKKTVIYLEKSEATVMLAFGCLNRAKRLVDLLVEPMPFDRLSKLCDKSTLKIRLGSAP